MNTKYFLIACLFLIMACSSEKAEQTQEEPKKERPIALENGKFFDQDGKHMLYGGESDLQHFDVSNSELKAAQFHYGIGREKFPALLEPQFTTVSEADSL